MQRQPLRLAYLVLPCVFALVACGGGSSKKAGGQDGGGGSSVGEDQDGDQPAATGGMGGTSEPAAIDGAPSTGGATGTVPSSVLSTGGSPGSAGTAAPGATPPTGGSTIPAGAGGAGGIAGGTRATGGSPITGGTVGGTRATGGTAISGGTRATGGSVITGGTVGGTSAAGGTSGGATGGTSSTGGTSAPGNTDPPGNPSGSCAIPAAAQAEPTTGATVVGDGTADSCTAAKFETAVQNGGVITFNCGPAPITITLDHPIKLNNKVGAGKLGHRVIDGGGKVTLSGGGTNRILYQDACEEGLGWINDHCNNSVDPWLVVQNLTFVDGKASDAGIGGAAIYSNGGSLKVVNCKFYRNQIIDVGPDVAGGAIYATQAYGTTYVVNSTFGGSAAGSNGGANGGALGGLFASYTILNSVLSYNKAVGNGMNPAKAKTPGGGSGGAIYNDGNSFTLTICGSDISHNSSVELGGAIFYVANDVKGHISIDQSTFTSNQTGNTDGPAPGVAKPGCYLQTTATNISITNTTFN
jgi:hypothetical protein